MIERGKYQSLTMINWNGFFARTFDIDNLVTTLSGGNGAGKSTTMAAFITALIPDQSLLHFRNTTEAGSSQASKDKGLFGKLQPGVCFSVLDIVNSRQQRILFGVKLQQVAGRDKKVDIKPFVIQGLDKDIRPTDILIESLSGSQARVKALPEIKQHISTLEQVSFKAFNSVAEYHSQMFDMGVLPKKLRNSGDRSKFYRLIEASLYGGISSAITRSLRDYLLPQNGGVKKAFQDMESALRENRLTLEAIKTTQADRDLFKHLITESTNYVASDYMRNANDRKNNIDQILSLRGELFSTKKQIIEQNNNFNQIELSLEKLVEKESTLEQEQQSASEFLQLVQNAIRQKEKIDKYQQDLEQLSEKVQEQALVVEEVNEQVEQIEEQMLLAENDVDSLQSQLADYQQALDVQQTRALQYQQAMEALTKAIQLTEEPQLEAANAKTHLANYKQLEQSKTALLLEVKHKLDVASAQSEKFEKGYELLCSIQGDASRDNAADIAKEWLSKLNKMEAELENESGWRAIQQQLKSDIEKQANAKRLCEKYHSLTEIELTNSDVVEQQNSQHQNSIEKAQQTYQRLRDKKAELTRNINQIDEEIDRLVSIAPRWIEANSARLKLEEQSGLALSSSHVVLQQMQKLMEQETTQVQRKDQLAAQRDRIDAEIEKLALPGNSDDARLKEIAETIGGVLLSEIYDDIAVEDAPYFSAMYGPARHAIVVPDLTDIKSKLLSVTDCPEDIYIIQGEPDAFDDTSFAVEELQGAVCVQFSDRQMRYSRIPEMSLFGRAAREQRVQQLRDDRAEIVEQHASVAFDAQKLSRLYLGFSQFVENHIQIAFEQDPDKARNDRSNDKKQFTRQLAEIEQQEKQLVSQMSLDKQALHLLAAVQPIYAMLANQALSISYSENEEKLASLQQSRGFITQHKRSILDLKPLIASLEVDPGQLDGLDSNYQQLEDELKQVKAQIFAIEDVCKRSSHFSYSDSANMLETSSELSEQLTKKLAEAELLRSKYRESAKSIRHQASQYNQVFVSLKSAYQAKSETVSEFLNEFNEFGVAVEHGTEQRASENKQLLTEQLQASRQEIAQLGKDATAIEFTIKSLMKKRNKTEKAYVELRSLVVVAKSGWCNVLHLAKENDVQRRLYRRELAYKSAGELRSMSDKSLGALRLAVADNESLRDALRLSEDSAYPERKVMFYIAVYQHLKERIRQDIIHTDDPVEAIEEMEIELARLAEELSQRESRLSISSESVANIIKKTIVREQNRIRMLNQGLSNINFGQVKGVRLNVNIRESHQILLTSLEQQQQQHKDLFESHRLTFSEAMAKMFKRVNPHIDMGQRSPQLLGEELLDYRNYLELSVEVNRGTDGWLQAESGALSTGEAIGTGQSILLMVTQSWEEESRRLRSKDIIPCRLLFLDEAARLDSKSISTLFELCDRLDMQLLIAAPENISPEKGTTYKLVRKIFKDHEHVHVVGLRGFGQTVEHDNHAA